MSNSLDKICKNCGLSLGAHSAVSYHSDFYKMYIPKDCCPGHEGRMNWDKGPGTTFEPTGTFGPIEYGTPALKGESNDLST